MSQTRVSWEEIQKHKRYSELEPDCVKRLTEARVNYLEKMLNIGQNPYYQRVFLADDECQAELKTENHFRV